MHKAMLLCTAAKALAATVTPPYKLRLQMWQAASSQRLLSRLCIKPASSAPAYLPAVPDSPAAPAKALLQLSRWKDPLPDCRQHQVLPAPPLTARPGLHPLQGLQPEGCQGSLRGCRGGC